MDILKAKPRWIRLDNNAQYEVPHGKGLIILGGSIAHVTASNTSVEVDLPRNLTPEVQTTNIVGYVPSATVNGTYPLFNALADVNHAVWSPTIYLEGSKLTSGGDAASYTVFCILEFDV